MSIAKDSTYILSSRTIDFFLGIITSIVVSRILGPSDRGVYFLVSTVNAMVISFGNMGVSFTNIYLISKRKRNINKVHSNSIFMVLFISGLVFFLYGIAKNYLHSNIIKGVNPLFTLVGIGLVPLSLYSGYWNSIMGGLKKFVLMSKLGILFSVIGTTMTLIILLVLRLGIKGLLGWWFLNSAIIIIVKLFIINGIDKIKVKFDKGLFKEVLWFGFKGHIGNIAGYLYCRMDMFIVNFFTGTTGAGFYSLSTSLAEKTRLLPEALLGAATPGIGGYKREESGLLTSRVIRHTLLLSVIVALLLLMTIPWLLPILYGVEYMPSVVPLLILLPGIVLEITTNGFANYITYQLGKPHVSSIITWITTIIYIPFSILMVSRFGIIGAAFTTTFIYIITFIVFYVFFKRYSGITTSEILLIKASDLKQYLSLISKDFQRLRAYTMPLVTFRR